jgi:hypothetical protein
MPSVCKISVDKSHIADLSTSRGEVIFLRRQNSKEKSYLELMVQKFPPLFQTWL